MAKLLSFMKSAVIFSLVFFAQVVAAAEFPPAPNPFHYINPCGYAGLEMCQLADFIGKEEATLDKVSPKLIKHFAELLGYNVTNL